MASNIYSKFTHNTPSSTVEHHKGEKKIKGKERKSAFRYFAALRSRLLPRNMMTRGKNDTFSFSAFFVLVCRARCRSLGLLLPDASDDSG
jgi:hypothetical protein